jgi:hypothetical protein
MQLNHPSFFPIFAANFLRENGGDIKRIMSIFGNTTEVFFNEQLRKGFVELFCKDRPGAKVGSELSYMGGASASQMGELHVEFPPAQLRWVVDKHMFFYDVMAEKDRASPNIRFKIVSKLNPKNSMMITEKETYFETIMGSMIKEDFDFLAARAGKDIKPEPEAKTQEELLASLPKGLNDWLPGEHLAGLATAIQRFIRETDASGWLQQGRELNCRTTYLNIRVDQRNGAFIVAGDSSPKIHIDHDYPDHMYPRGWDSKCKLNPMLLKLCLDLNEQMNAHATEPQLRVQVGMVEEWLKEMVSRHVLEISSKKSISGEQLMKYYGKKS